MFKSKLDKDRLYAGTVDDLHPCEFGFGDEWANGQAEQIIFNDDLVLWINKTAGSIITIERLLFSKFYQYKVTLDLGNKSYKIYRIEVVYDMQGNKELLPYEVGTTNAGKKLWDTHNKGSSWPR
jgi:hypothetical protein